MVRVVHFPSHAQPSRTMRVVLVLAALATLALAHPWEKDTPARRALIIEACPVYCEEHCPDCCKEWPCPNLCCVRAPAFFARLPGADAIRASERFRRGGVSAVYDERVIHVRSIRDCRVAEHVAFLYLRAILSSTSESEMSSSVISATLRRLA
jgi:hypothetical protein